MQGQLEAIESEQGRAGGARLGGTREDDDAPIGDALGLRLEDGREVVVGRRLRIGTAADNDVVLEDVYVSAWHCVVTRLGSRVVVVDYGSRNGTMVNRTRVSSADLRPGMRLTLGRSTLRVIGEAADVPAGGLIGSSEPMQRLRDQLALLAPKRASVLLLGESGTGKELAAHALHDQSGRKGPLVVVNCGALSPELAESELFGHERGSFTGAGARHRGLFEEAAGGTLFLDEVGELPLPLQPKLLRALEAGTVRAVGAVRERAIDVRVVAATHRDLRREVVDGRFRLDLYHRLAAVEVRVPALRERSDDLPLLAQHFLEQQASESGPKVLSPAAREAIATYGWPGNVRELRNAIQRAAIFGGDILQPSDVLPLAAGEALDETAQVVAPRDGKTLADVERALIVDALRSHGSLRAAASALGVAKSTLCDRVRRLEIDPASL